jgi:putative addiction module component (TIGR02574 family)
MSPALEALEAEALKLPPSDRSHLVEHLLVSLDADAEPEKAWALEVDRREAELESGAVEAVSGEQAMERLRASSGKATETLT